MSKMEGDKKPYQPTDEEIHEAWVMSPKGNRRFVPRVMILEEEHDTRGLIRFANFEGDTHLPAVYVENDKVKVIDEQKNLREEFRSKEPKYKEITIEEALAMLDKEENDFREEIGILQTVIQRIKNMRQNVMNLKEKQEKK